MKRQKNYRRILWISGFHRPQSLLTQQILTSAKALHSIVGWTHGIERFFEGKGLRGFSIVNGAVSVTVVFKDFIDNGD